MGITQLLRETNGRKTNSNWTMLFVTNDFIFTQLPIITIYLMEGEKQHCGKMGKGNSSKVHEKLEGNGPKYERATMIMIGTVLSESG